MNRICKLIYAVLFMAIFLQSCSKDNPTPDTPDPKPGNEFAFPKKGMRAVWMTTAWGLDWPQGEYNVTAQKQRYIAYLDKFKSLNVNSIFFQIKAMGDAFYDSPYEPWSAAITGSRGQDPNYDVLK